MKNRISRMATAIAMGFFCVMMLAIGTGYAEDVKLEGKISAVQVSQDKNGKEYVRALLPEKRQLNGISYDTTVAVMFFGDTDRKSTRLNSSHIQKSRMPSSA